MIIFGFIVIVGTILGCMAAWDWYKKKTATKEEDVAKFVAWLDTVEPEDFARYQRNHW